MSNADAEAAKAAGNAAFKAGNHDEAIQHFSKAIELDPKHAVYYSNRSMVYATKGDFEAALTDGQKCIELRPDWPKAYSRAGLALFKLNKLPEAKAVYEQGLQKCPGDATLQSNLDQVQQQMSPFSAMFGDSMWTKLAMHPDTKDIVQDPVMVQKLKALQQNPNLLQQYLADPSMMKVISVLLGIDMSMMNPSQDSTPAESKGPEPVPEKPRAPAAPEPKKEPERKLSPEEQKQLEIEKEANAKKEEGNVAFKKRKFDEALGFYSEACTINPKEPTFHSNIAAVYFQQGAFEKCVEECNKAIQLGNEKMGAFKIVAKAYVRKAKAFEKMQRFDDAIEAYEKSLVEVADSKVRHALKEVEKRKKKAEDEAYVNPELAEKHKNNGNALFKEGKFPDAVKEYTEALRRDPKNHKIYSNRAWAYTKLMDWSHAMDDCNKCLELDSSFVKAYVRKGKIQHFLKQYYKAIETYEEGLKLDPNNQELKQAIIETQMAVRRANSGEVDQQQVQEAMKDPEIQRIMRDPSISRVLQSMQNDPSTAQRAMQDPTIRASLEKLMAAGILRMG